MEINCQEQDSESLSTGVFEIPGEPAIVINGVPNVPPCDGTLVLCDTANATSGKGSQRDTGFGRWLEGREVRKQFGEQIYPGTVTKFDKESGWYRVVYEDGDFEDLDWNELEAVLLPLDITIPVKALALKIIKKSQKPVGRPRKTLARSTTHQPKNVGRKRRAGQAPEGVPLLMIESADCRVT